jgi:Flp pilus assembly protein TadG
MAAVRLSNPEWRSDRGAELVEFALVLPLMLLMLLGIIDFGLLFQRFQVVTNAAREGARVATLPGYGDVDIETRVTQFLTAGGLTEAPTIPPPTRTAVDLGGQCINVVTVTVEYPYSFSAVGALASYFDGTGFSRSGLQVTASMRSDLAAVASC